MTYAERGRIDNADTEVRAAVGQLGADRAGKREKESRALARRSSSTATRPNSLQIHRCHGLGAEHSSFAESPFALASELKRGSVRFPGTALLARRGSVENGEELRGGRTSSEPVKERDCKSSVTTEIE